MTTVEHPQIDYTPRRANKEFYTKRGRLTRYSFACGYLERHNTDRTDRATNTTMWLESNCFHIRTTIDTPTSFIRLAWDVADTLTEARKIYARHIKEYHR